MLRAVGALILLGCVLFGAAAAPAGAETPLCALAPQFNAALFAADAALGAAVVDVRSGRIWAGGQSGPYPVHSVVKVPIAVGYLSHKAGKGETLTEEEEEQLRGMVALSKNRDVDAFLQQFGGFPALQSLYEAWGLPDLAKLVHPYAWGRGRATPAQLARLFNAVATDERISEAVRQQLYESLRQADPTQVWGATIPPSAPAGWESLIKTGNYTIVLEWEEEEFEEEEEEPPLEIRMNSAALWLDGAGSPRYVIVVMQVSGHYWWLNERIQNRVGALLAEAVLQREFGQPPLLSPTCLKQVLS